ncbi:MAG: malectin domain-containing carbohydrate-binding protein [Candidatus Hinthialibacter antarcticus]|nr:malectin domain-containing carbohydrate-binding protein [Candidatus Hinthialibacter antarcticus]
MMTKHLGLIFCFILIILGSSYSQIVIVTPPDASSIEQLAAKEIQRYLYVRTGIRFDIRLDAGSETQVVAVAAKKSNQWNQYPEADFQQQIANLQDSGYHIQTFLRDGTKSVCIVGGGDSGVLYGAYRFAESLGIRFGLHGDIIPDETMKAELPEIHVQASPLFRIRGVQPFHDFPEGPDWWNAGEYKSILAQLPKLGMNFFALHCYPEEFPIDPKAYPNAEPSVWIGLKDDLNEDGTVAFSYPSSWYNTARGNWGYQPKKTSAYSFGASTMFERDDFGGDVMEGRSPQPASLEDSNALFNDAGALLGDAFSFARSLGIQTCIGAETPLTLPVRLKERLRRQGRDFDSIQTAQALYEGMFKRLMLTAPIDYYWFWTPERWTWQGNSPEQIQHTKDDLTAAMRAAEAVEAPFQFATCGWVLGPVQDRALFDRFLPKSFSMSCINRQVGKEPVDPAFKRIEDRSLWAIPWLEDDPNLLMPQLWAGRMRADAVDARDYGCDGILGIHWRTRVLDPNVQALAKAAWNQDWKQEQITRNRNESLKGANYVQIPKRPINKTNTPDLYTSQIEGPLQYQMSAPNGVYTVTLHFCETEATRANQRVFDVVVQGATVLKGFDPFKRAGRYTAHVESFSARVANETLSIHFSPVKGAPRIAALEIEGRGMGRRVNCGGGDYLDFTADLPLELSVYRDQPVGDFYQDWAYSQFGAQAGEKAADLFSSLDGELPITTTWVRGPGSLKPDSTPWDVRQTEYAYVQAFENLRGDVQGPLSLERFEYWSNQFHFQKTIAHIQCLWHQYNLKMQEANRESVSKQAEYAKAHVLPLRMEIIRQIESAYQFLVNTVCTTGGMGMIANWEQQNFPALLDAPARELSSMLGEELPAAALLRKDYPGPERLIVLTPRSLYRQGEPLQLRVIHLGEEQPEIIQLKMRAIGDSEWLERKARSLSNRVFHIDVPFTDLPEGGFEYYVEAVHASGGSVASPASAPKRGWTAVVTKM